MTNRAEDDRREIPQVVRRTVRQHLVGAKIAIASEIKIRVIELEAKLLASGVQHLDVFCGYLGAGAVAADYCDVVTVH